jgi:hypothetical protein
VAAAVVVVVVVIPAVGVFVVVVVVMVGRGRRICNIRVVPSLALSGCAVLSNYIAQDHRKNDVILQKGLSVRLDAPMVIRHKNCLLS